MVVRSEYLRCALAALAGAAVSTAHPLGIIAAIAMPAFALSQQGRRAAYALGSSYYAAALWPLIPGARNFFGPDVSALAAVALWVASSVLLALPWPLVWSPDRRQAIWRAPAGLALTVLPPLGIIGWASPLTAAGILFPGLGWCGLLLCACSGGCLMLWPRRAAIVLAGMSLACNAIRWRDPQPPPDWKTVDTAFGGIAHRPENAIAEYATAQSIQHDALTAAAKVIVFPETVVPTWTVATDAFWQQTLDRLRSSGKTVLIGARVPVAAHDNRSVRYDFSADLAALNALPGRMVPFLVPKPPIQSGFAYDNAVIVRGAKIGVVTQRIPVPVAMWNPLRTTAAHLHLWNAAVIDLDGQRAAMLVCYEQLLTWPVLVSMVERPTILIAIANDYWAAGTPIPRFQLAAVRAWARLFSMPCLSAVNR